MVKKPPLKSWKLVIPESLMTRLKKHLFPGDNDEHGAIITAGVVSNGRESRLLARDLFIAKDGIEYVAGKHSYRILKAEFILDKILYCRDEHLAYLAIHCHQGSDSVWFSGVDIASHERGYPALLDIVQGMPVGALVLSENAIAGDIWLPDGIRVNIAETDIVGNTTRKIYPEPPPLPPQVDKTYDRQARIFGDRGQYILDKLKVGVIGLGGAGSLINEYLARLGVGHLVLVDPDCIDRTNKPRIVGSTERDVAKGTRKVDIAARVAKAANSKIRVENIFGDITEDDIARQFIDCDYLFLAADSMQARLVFNAIVHQYLIPGIQVGAKVQVNPSNGKIINVFCVSRPVRPDSGCLLCNGLIDPRKLQEEALSEAERQEQQYITEPTITAPSVITLNALASSQAVNYFLFAITDLLASTVANEYLRWQPQLNDFCFDIPRKDIQCRDCGLGSESRFARGDFCELPTKLKRKE